MNVLRFLILLFAVSSGVSAQECDYPPLVSIPSGADSTMDELLAAQGAIREYMASMNEYMDCVDAELTAAGDDAPEEYKAIMLSRYNAAVAEMETIASDFNVEVQAYREANPEGD
ncbi:MAG: hypothetical protein CMM56_04155 [Rhodospirillaceae bacterium]|nr:hypothetical protein [Rhodospirillaceae bacterium]|tara:strand:+ start:408 stop:752 length:345 start_codon:yes stop_codon:yes gene_type:complete